MLKTYNQVSERWNVIFYWKMSLFISMLKTPKILKISVILKFDENRVIAYTTEKHIRKLLFSNGRLAIK